VAHIDGDEIVWDEILWDEEAQRAEETAIESVMRGESPRRKMSDDEALLISEFVEFAVKLSIAGGTRDFSFDEREYLRDIYDASSRRVLLKCGRQVEKSTLLGNLCLAYSALNPAFKTLYVSSAAQQAQVFSADRIKEPIDTSKVLSALTNKDLSQNVFFKQFTNRSQIRLRYAFLSADRVRGIPADMILIDEIQDILTDNIPVIEECASHSEHKLMRYSGTPKSLDNTIEKYWADHSTQNEWLVPCDHCNNWNELGERNIGKKGPICGKCGEPINVRHERAQWASKQPRTEENEDRVSYEGFRIPQIMVPWVVADEEGWKDILLKQEQYSRARFHNEVLGLSFDMGTRPLKRNHIESCCLDSVKMAEVDDLVNKAGGVVFMGLDWGTGESSSFTVMTLGGYIEGRFTIFFAHRFTGQELEPPVQLDIIARMVHRAKVKLIGADYGGGFDRNDFLQRTFGREKVWKYQYAARPNQKLLWQPKLQRFIVHRTEVLSDMFNAIKRRQLRFPCWNEFQAPYAEDMLNIFSEHNDMLNMTQYKISPGRSDDTMHSILYCFLVSMLYRSRPDILIPSRENDIVMPE
jgi:hypothetical protein